MRYGHSVPEPNQLKNNIMEKTITIKIEDARRYYLSGNEDLRELALNAFNEDELIVVGLPTSAEEFTEKYGAGFLNPREQDEYEAHAMLRKLRDLYRGCDEYEYRRQLHGRYQWCIVKMYSGTGEYYTISHYMDMYNDFLSFTEQEVAAKFLALFEPLIKKAGDLI